ncbi:MAG: hypothetical protein NTW38_11000 [Candidatus Aminicenantes bacterium]|nr:hypothetical protein [Candidatus Aminicenantes bacterium]
MKNFETESDAYAPTLAELKAEYVAYLIESTFQKDGDSFPAEEVLEKALYYRLSVVWMGGHDNCVFTLGSKNLSSH